MSEDGYQPPNGLPANLTGAVSATRYVGGTASVAPTTGTFAVGDYVVTQAGGVYVCTVAGTPGTWVDSATIGPSVSSVFTRTGAVVATDGDYYGVVAAAKTGATAASRYAGATASGAPASGTFAVGDFVIAQNAHVFVCTVAGSPGTWVDAGGAGAAVTSVFSRTGAVVAASNDYTFAQINTAANAIAVSKLAAGAAGQAVGGTTPAYFYPPGTEYLYTAITTSVTVSGTTEGGATSCIGPTGSYTFDGSTSVYLEVYSPKIDVPGNVSGNFLIISIWEDSTSLGVIGQYLTGTSVTEIQAPLLGKLKRTPAAGAHTYTIKAYRSNANCTFGAGAGGSDTLLGAYLRVAQA